MQFWSHAINSCWLCECDCSSYSSHWHDCKCPWSHIITQTLSLIRQWTQHLCFGFYFDGQWYFWQSMYISSCSWSFFFFFSYLCYPQTQLFFSFFVRYDTCPLLIPFQIPWFPCTVQIHLLAGQIFWYTRHIFSYPVETEDFCKEKHRRIIEQTREECLKAHMEEDHLGDEEKNQGRWGCEGSSDQEVRRFLLCFFVSFFFFFWNYNLWIWWQW